jgi:hypothetical protein
MPPSVCFVVGARPNFMKAAPVIGAHAAKTPETRVLLVQTGQHYDHGISTVFLDTHAEQTAGALAGVEGLLLEHRPAAVKLRFAIRAALRETREIALSDGRADERAADVRMDFLARERGVVA